MYFSKKQRDLAMRIILNAFYDSENKVARLSKEYLYEHGLSNQIDADLLLEVLESMGFINYRYNLNAQAKLISLTPKGKCYFEEQADQDSNKRAEWIRYLITTIISVIAIILSAISLAAQTGLIKLPTA